MNKKCYFLGVVLDPFPATFADDFVGVDTVFFAFDFAAFSSFCASSRRSYYLSNTAIATSSSSSTLMIEFPLAS